MFGFGPRYIPAIMKAAEKAKNPDPGWCECPPDNDSKIMETLASLGEDVNCVCMKCNRKIKPLNRKKPMEDIEEIRPSIDVAFLTAKELKSLYAILERQAKKHTNSAIAAKSTRAASKVEARIKGNTE